MSQPLAATSAPASDVVVIGAGEEPQRPVMPGARGGASFNPYAPYRGALLSPARVRELSVLRPWRVVRDAAWCWVWIVWAWACAAVVREWWVVAIAMVVVGERYYALFIMGHDGMHRRLFKSFRVNDVFCDVFLLGPMGMVTHINDRNHLAHHRHLATEKDPDLHKHACFNKTTVPEYLAFLSGLASVLSVARNLFVRRGAGGSAAGAARSEMVEADDAAARDSAGQGYTVRDAAILLGWQGGLIVGLTWAFGWWGYPVMWLVPVYLFTYLPNLVRSFVEHSHPEPDDEADRHRLVTFVSNPLERLFMSPMNMNYHVVHHLWPSIPYYNLPIADGEIRGKPGAEGLIWRGSYLAYLMKYLGALPLPACREARERALARADRAGEAASA